MRLEAALEGDLKRLLADELKAGEAAVKAGISEATDGLKLELRQQITGAGLSQRLANTWRGEVYPKCKNSLRAAGLVYSRAPDIVRAYANGAVMRRFGKGHGCVCLFGEAAGSQGGFQSVAAFGTIAERVQPWWPLLRQCH